MTLTWVLPERSATWRDVNTLGVRVQLSHPYPEPHRQQPGRLHPAAE